MYFKMIKKSFWYFDEKKRKRFNDYYYKVYIQLEKMRVRKEYVIKRTFFLNIQMRGI